MKVHEFESIVLKLDLRTRNAGDRLAWFEYEGKVVARTKRSHGRGDLPGHLIRQQLKLNENELAGIISCSLYRKDYIEILKRKGLIAKTENKEEITESNQSENRMPGGTTEEQKHREKRK